MPNSSRLYLLGKPRLFAGNQFVELSSHQLALLSLFTLKDTDVLDRGYAARLLWPKASSAGARHSLSQALYVLKAATGDTSPVSGSRTSLHVVRLTTDYSVFVRAVSKQDWLEAEGAYRGQLLEGFDLREAEELNELIDSCRRDLVDMCVELVQGLQLDGRSIEAARLVERIAQPQLMSLLLASSARSESAMLHNEAAILPNLEPTPFVGRQAEMETLERHHQGVIQSGFRTVIVEGEAGIGKTALARRFTRLWAIRGGTVLRATGFVAEQNLPFGVVAQWLRDVDTDRFPVLEAPWSGVIEEAFPGTMGQPMTAQDNVELRISSEFRLLEALRNFFKELSADRPLLVLLDDAQYSDATSIAFAHYFSRRSRGAPVLFLATLRTSTLDGNDPFEGWSTVDRLVLGPLSIRDTAKLAARYSIPGPEPDLDTVSRLSRRTGGNPLLIASLLASHNDVDSTKIPDTVVKFFRPRLDALSTDAALLMASIAVIGDAADRELAAQIAGLADDSRMSGALSELRAAGLLMPETDEGLRPRHGIVADIAVNGVSAAERRALYGRAARALAEDGRSSPAVLAIQHDIAGDKASAFDAALSAASASQKLYATREHEYFLKLALSNAPDKEAEVSIRIRLAELYRRTGRSTEALDMVTDGTLNGASDLQRSRARASRLAIRLLGADTRISSRAAWEEIEELSATLEPELIAELYLHLAVAGRDHGDRAPTVEAATRSLAIARDCSPTPNTVIIAVRAANILGLWVDAPRCLDIVRSLLDTAESNAEVLGQCLSAQASLLVCVGKLIDAEARFLQAVELIERCCMYDALFALHNNLGVCYTELGRYGEAQRQLEEAARVGDELGRQRSTVAAENLAMLHLERGEHDLALRTVRGAMTKATSRSPRELFHRHALIGLCSLELGLLAQAFEAKREIDLLFQQHEYWGSDVSYVETFLARMLVMEGRPEAARARLETAVEIYQPRDVMCRARLELELVRLDLKTDPAGALERAESMLETLRGTGARPLVDRFEELADRARRHAD
jgi:tetratricopeptide (TPR) repeat protein